MMVIEGGEIMEVSYNVEGEAKGKRKKRKRSWKQEVKRNWPLYVLLVPSFISVLIFSYAPMGGVYMSLLRYKPWLGILGSEFIGFDNFIRIFEFPESYQ